MPTDTRTAEYILEQLQELPYVRVRKMFGEYALYCDEKVVGLICDDQLYIKYTDAGTEYAQKRFIEGTAYPGAKPSMNVTDYIDDREFLSTLVRLTATSLPLPKKKLKKI